MPTPRGRGLCLLYAHPLLPAQRDWETTTSSTAMTRTPMKTNPNTFRAYRKRDLRCPRVFPGLPCRVLCQLRLQHRHRPVEVLAFDFN
jgi:hypothetical protein